MTRTFGLFVYVVGSFCVHCLFTFEDRFFLYSSIACVNDIIQKLLYKSVSIQNFEESQ